MNENYIKKLIRILENSSIDSIQLSSFWGMSKIKLFKNAKIESKSTKPEESKQISNTRNIKNHLQESEIPKKQETISISSEVNTTNNQTNESSSLHEIKAPLVGTFYLSPKPGEPPFIKIGDKIEPGQILYIIEAMKIFNEIESEITGVVKEILTNDSTPVEYGQVIILVETND